MHNPANKLLKWKMISEEYKKHINKGMPATQILRQFIYPKYFISYRTLMSVLQTPIDKELKALGYTQEQINKHVIRFNNVAESSTSPGGIMIQSDNPYLNQPTASQIY